MPHIGYFPKPEYPRPLAIGSPAFVPRSDEYDWFIGENDLENRTVVNGQSFYAPVFLPHRATVTKLKLWGYRSDAGASLQLTLERITLAGYIETMANLTADWTDGNGSIETTTINYATIDNAAYHYILKVYLNPAVIASDGYFKHAKIYWS